MYVTYKHAYSTPIFLGARAPVTHLLYEERKPLVSLDLNRSLTLSDAWWQIVERSQEDSSCPEVFSPGSFFHVINSTRKGRDWVSAALQQLKAQIPPQSASPKSWLARLYFDQAGLISSFDVYCPVSPAEEDPFSINECNLPFVSALDLSVVVLLDDEGKILSFDDHSLSPMDEKIAKILNECLEKRSIDELRETARHAGALWRSSCRSIINAKSFKDRMAVFIKLLDGEVKRQVRRPPSFLGPLIPEISEWTFVCDYSGKPEVYYGGNVVSLLPQASLLIFFDGGIFLKYSNERPNPLLTQYIQDEDNQDIISRLDSSCPFWREGPSGIHFSILRELEEVFGICKR